MGRSTNPFSFTTSYHDEYRYRTYYAWVHIGFIGKDSETGEWVANPEFDPADRIGPFKTRKAAAEALLKNKEGEGVTA